MYEIKISKINLENLKVFLSRANLTGQEVPAFNMVINSIYQAKKLDEEENINDTKKAGD